MWFRNVRRCALLAVLLAAGFPIATAHSDDLAGKGSIGASLGVMRFTGNADLSEGAGIRPILRLSFRYAAHRFVSVLEAGYGWNAYGQGGEWAGADSVGTLAVVKPFTVGLDYRLRTENSRFLPRVGAGLGVYSIQIRSGRDRISRDRLTSADRQVTAPGLYGKIGTDYVSTPSLVFNVDALWHYAFSADEEKFPSGFLNANASFIEGRVGISYYFNIASTGPAPTKPEGTEEE
jgi:hypothetical protein